MGMPRAFKNIGPGLVMAATGVGAGDLVAAMFAGARFGDAVLWAVVLGAATKLALNEGIARWQCATGTPLLEAWCRHLGRPFRFYFLAFLVGWSFVVGAALMSASGVVAHAIVPALPVPVWGVAHSLLAIALVLFGRYAMFESIMMGLVGLMVAALLGCAAFFVSDPGALARGLFVPRLPPGSGTAILALVGGLGGSVSMLAYGYWIRERGWAGAEGLRIVRRDLTVAYVLTGLFVAAVLVIAAGALGGRTDDLPSGSAALVALADAISGAVYARAGVGAAWVARLVFLLGVWATVLTSVLGVWQGIPYLFTDYVGTLSGRFGQRVDTRSWTYRGFMLYIAIAPMVLLALGRPVWLILIYTLVSSTFMPLLAGSLLWLNSRRALVGGMANSALINIVLAAAALLVAVLAGQEVIEAIR